MKDHEHTVVVLGGRHLIELAVCVESQQPALFARHCPSVVQVPFVTHNHYGYFVRTQAVLGGFDSLNEPANCVETGPVADAVDQNKAIGPPHLLLKE